MRYKPDDAEFSDMLKVAILGMIGFSGIVIFLIFLKSQEYPDISFESEISNQWVKKSENTGRVSHIDLKDGRKFRVITIENQLNLEYSYPQELLGRGVFISKKKSSDTLIIKLKNVEYKYRLKY